MDETDKYGCALLPKQIIHYTQWDGHLNELAKKFVGPHLLTSMHVSFLKSPLETFGLKNHSRIIGFKMAQAFQRSSLG